MSISIRFLTGSCFVAKAAQAIKNLATSRQDTARQDTHSTTNEILLKHSAYISLKKNETKGGKDIIPANSLLHIENLKKREIAINDILPFKNIFHHF